jgi:adenylate kinase family enzyme
MRRVLVIGCSGSGKSTFSQRLHVRTGLPLISLDAHYWQPGWVQTPRSEWRPKVADLAARESWIMDGTFDSSLDLRLPRADTVIWFRLPRWLCLLRVARRVMKSYGVVRPEMAPGCPERMDFAFLSYIWHFERRETPHILAMLATHGRQMDPVIFRHDADVQRFLDSVTVPSKT